MLMRILEIRSILEGSDLDRRLNFGVIFGVKAFSLSFAL